MKLFPLRNPDIEISDDMADALNWFCARCRMHGVKETTAAEVRAFLREEEKRPDLADQFVSDLLYPHPANAG